MDIKLVTPLVPFAKIVKTDEETNLHIIHVDYIAKLVGGELKVGSDIGEALWVGEKDIPKICQIF